MGVICILFALVFLASSHVLAGSDQDVCTSDKNLTAVQGEPFIIDFEYKGATQLNVEYTKDGAAFVPDKHRTFAKRGRIFVANVTLSDSGMYSFSAGSFRMKVCLIVLLLPANQRNSSRFLSNDLCIMRAIALLDSKQLLIDKLTPSNRSLPTAEPSASVRQHWHILSKDGAIQGRARMLLEDMIQLAIDCIPGDGKEEILNADAMENMLDFAGCARPPDLYNCSTPTVNLFRTADSTCNNLAYPLWGAANTAFSRLRPAEYEDGIHIPVGYDQLVNGDPFAEPWPSAREISRRIARDLPPLAPVSHLMTSMSQFVAHDVARAGEFVTTGCEETCNPEELTSFCYPIKVHRRDPVYGRQGPNMGRCLPITRTVGECIQSPDENTTFTLARQQLNQITHYLDGSAIYGSSEEEFAELRSFMCGRLKVGGRSDSNKGNPPFGIIPSLEGIPFFQFGDRRANAITPLMAFQTIFLREHNRLATELAGINPCWDDERIFQEARKIVGALVQIFTYEEMLPSLYGPSMYDKYIGPYPGYDPNTPAIISNEFTTASFRFAHSMLSDSFARLDIDNNPLPIGPLGLRDAFLNSLQYYISGGTDPLIRGYLQDQSRASDEFINRVFTTQLFTTPSNESLGHDIVSRDIQRGREHGFPPYRRYARFCEDKYNVRPKFSEEVAKRLRQVYGSRTFRRGMDLYIASLAEEHIEGVQFGPTLACTMGIGFSDLRNGDRFWWENPGIFTDSQRAALSTIRLSKVICDNADNIPMIRRNVFAPGGIPVTCSSLPGLDLNLWNDDTCSGHSPSGLCA